MKLLRDPLGRPIPRLFFEGDELDVECERIVENHMKLHAGGFRLPIPTDEIVRMVDMESEDFNMFAELPEDEEGYTDYFFERLPDVMISNRLSDPRYENRLRFTLCHEFGHVHFHAPLWRNAGIPADRRPAEPCWTCHRDTIVTAPENDWMEWQAGYIGGALLMPKSHVSSLSAETAARHGKGLPLRTDTVEGRKLIGRTSWRCQVSWEAARIRLLRLQLIALPATSDYP
jgi:Zn-dependent peptidase ImmA (M78 family)